MNLQFAIKSAFKYGAVGALVLAASSSTYRAQADEWDKRTVLTVDQPIQVTKTVLQPGTYVFKLLDSPSNRNIVQIFNADQTHLITTVLAIPNYRLQPTGNSRFSFYETPAGSPKAMHAWFYPGDNYGQEFPYPKQLAMLTASTAAPAPVLTPSPAPEPQVQAPAPAPPVAEQSLNQTPTQPEPPVEIAQNNPPPPPVVETPAPPAAQEPVNLPKTATPFPLFGLGGLFSFAAFGLLRLTRIA